MNALEPGGRLIYSTCSLEPEENEQVVETVLGASSGMRLVAASELLQGLVEAAVLTREAFEMLTATAVRGSYLRTLPGVHPCDGFFAAVITKS